MIPLIGDFVLEDKSLINQILGKDLLKKIFYHCCRFDIEDNNEKADLLAELLGPEFEELGTGTNRATFLYSPSKSRKFKYGGGLIFKFALDRRG